MKNSWQLFRSDQSGGVAVTCVLVIVMVLGIGGLVIDLGHLYTVRSEVRKAAEAGACAGARALLLPQGITYWNWINATATATSAVQQNSADNISFGDFTNATVQVGYWDLSWNPKTAPDHLLGFANPDTFVPNNMQAPAVKVTINKTTGGAGSGAPVVTYLASILGVGSMNVSFSAVMAVLSVKGSPYSDAFPFALPYSYVDQNWKNDPPTTFRVAANQHVDSGGQWTSFKISSDGANYIDGLILGTDTTDWIIVGDQIYIQNGERASIYNTAALEVGVTRYVPVVEDNFQNGQYTKVKAFVPFQITAVNGSGNDPYVEGHFVPGWVDPRAIGGGGKGFGDPLYKIVQ